MVERIDGLRVTVSGDISDLRRSLQDATRLGRGFGATLTDAFEDAALNGRKLSDVLRNLSSRISSAALRQAIRPLETGIGNLFGSVLSGITGGNLSGLGNAITGFANGGVIGQPTAFPIGRGGTGIAGEAGPEAVLPLARGGDGRLGVRAGGEGRPLTINFNVSTPDAASFRRSETQISAMVARAVDRGNRNL